MLAEVCRRRSSSSGITAYAVLGGADFGAGFWHLTAGGGRARRRACASIAPALDGPGVGGQPRLADLRAGDPLDGVPGRFGSIASTLTVPLFIAAVGIILRGTALRAARRSAATDREARASALCSRCRRSSRPFASARRSAASRRAGCRSATRRATRSTRWLNPTSILDRRARRRHRRATWRRSTWPPTPTRRAAGPRASVPPARARPGAVAGRSRSAAWSWCAPTRRALFDGLTSGAGSRSCCCRRRRTR